MALRKIIETEGIVTVQTPFGVIDKGTQQVSFSAYIKVVSVFGNKNLVNASVSFTGDTQQFIKQYEVPMSVETNSTNFIAQAYAHLKTLPEFAGATDC